MTHWFVNRVNWFINSVSALVFAYGQIRCEWHEQQQTSEVKPMETDPDTTAEIDLDEFILRFKIIELVISKFERGRSLEYKEFARLVHNYLIVRAKNREIVRNEESRDY